MKKSVILLALALAWSGCQKKVDDSQAFMSDFVPDSAGTAMLTTLAERVPEMSPAGTYVFAKTDEFSLTNKDIAGLFLRSVNVQHVNLPDVPTETIVKVLGQIAEGEAQRRLLYNEAVRQGITVADGGVDSTLNEIYKAYGGQEKFTQMIEQTGFTLDDVRNDQYVSLKIQGLLKKLAEGKGGVTEEDIQKQMNQDVTATVRHILFMTQGKTDSEIAEIRKKAEGVLARAKAGEDFEKLVKNYSEDPGSKDKGGLYEKFPRGRMVPEFEDASFNLPIGSISDLVETAYGFHIIKIESREKETRSHDEIKADLEAKHSDTMQQQVLQDELTRLKDEKHLEMLYPPKG